MLTSAIDKAWSGSFEQNGVSYTVTTSVSASTVASEVAGIAGGAQNVIGLTSEDIASHVNGPNKSGPGYDTGRFSIIDIDPRGSQFIAVHEFSHKLGLDDNHGNALSNNNCADAGNCFHDPHAREQDFRWAFGPDLPSGKSKFTVGQREGTDFWANARGNRKWWEGYRGGSNNH